MPERIQFSRRRGARMPEGAVYVGRHMSETYGRWGNPFRIGGTYGAHPGPSLVVRDRADAVAAFRRWIELGFCGHDYLERARAELAGKDLACWCPLVDAGGHRVPCHADVLLEIANAAPTTEETP